MLHHRAVATRRHIALRLRVATTQEKLWRTNRPMGSRLSSAEAGGVWERFVRWSYSRLGTYFYPPKADICNCGVDFNIVLPETQLLLREGIEQGSVEWRMQMYGAALYWHSATTPREGSARSDPEMFRGKDVLEVACMRGGGAHYLASVVAPRSYVGIDNVQEHIDICQRHPPRPNLSFELADALSLSNHFAAASFDVVLCIQAVAKFANIPHFIQEASRLLRPGGRLIICDAFQRNKFKVVLDALEGEELQIDACTDLSRAVHAVGLCQVPMGISYVHIIGRKDDRLSEES